MNPSTGTFISMDTYEGSIYGPDTLHKYMYANGNPVTYSDPSGNFASAVGGLVATTINTVMNNFQTLNAMGIISGLTNSAITAFLGGSDMEIGEAFFKGYVTGFGLGAVLYVAAAYSVIVFAKMYLLISASNVSMSVVMTIASVIEKKERETLVYGTLAILSLLTLVDAYNFNCMVNIIGDKGSATIGWEYSNPEEVAVEGDLATDNSVTGTTTPDFIVTPKGTVMDTSKNYNLVGSGEKGDWFQIHNIGKAEEGYGFPHTHKPQKNTDGIHISYSRVVSDTIAEDIDLVDNLLRTRKMTIRKGKR